MKVLGIESTCDETSVAVVEDGIKVLSNVVASQVDLHQKFGGVVPEIASRKHVELILPVLQEALDQAECQMKDIDLIASVNRPGLIGALIVGVSTAKALSWAHDIPMVGVHHLEGHIYANFLVNPDLQFPFVCLIVSGGHSDIVYMPGHGRYEILARTRDDAAGEAFDKSARAMGLGYPGGPAIDKASQGGNPKAIRFPRARLDDSLDFSFSGLKTAVIRYIAGHPDGVNLADLAASFQQAVVDVLVDNTFKAAQERKVKQVVVAGGVAANKLLQQQMKNRGEELGINVSIPPPRLCTDNAAMSASAGYFAYQRGVRSGLDLDSSATEPLAERVLK